MGNNVSMVSDHCCSGVATAAYNRHLSDEAKIRLISEYICSGKSIEVWCKERNIGVSTMYEWARKLRDKGYSFPDDKKFSKHYLIEEKYQLVCEILSSCENHTEEMMWCRYNNISFHKLMKWKKTLDKNGYNFDRFSDSSSILIRNDKFYRENDYASCFDIDPIGVKIHGKTYKKIDEAPIYLYPGNEDYRWIVFHWDSCISVLETARANSMDVWRWDRNHNEWELIMRYKDSEEEFWAENKDRPDFQKIYQHKRVWKYLSQLLIPWTDEELDTKEKCYWEQVVSY